MGNPPSPRLEVDHINRCKLDNRRVNLRWVTRSENIFNVSDRTGTVTGVRNVYRKVSRTGRITFTVMKQVDGKMKYIGSFRTLTEATAARDASRKGG